ncbi:P-loop NTPase fold protein [Burkholderia gladioli]|uniref:P-loop NTPase fold protein n=1 Tax=Burkholderia gladioli TaxID=28095 RepID=UPI00164156F6|nr:P-loop NTPase fold protein [Burkholderia gladioli]URV27850.1 KAP family NTPase [Burkholderia gladioli]
MKQTTHDNEQEQEEQWPQLISDMPSKADDIGSFNELVKAIHRMLVHTRGGMTVSINGSWGTGKSTFIRLLETELKAAAKPHAGEPIGWRRCLALPKRLVLRGAARVGMGRKSDRQIDAHVFVYDTWAHTGDPLRRAFLSDLLASLRDRPRYDQSIWLRQSPRFRLRSLLGNAALTTRGRGMDWNTFAERLAGRHRVSKRRAKVKVGWLGRLVVVAGAAWAIRHPLRQHVIEPLLPELTKRLVPLQSFAASKLAFVLTIVTPDMARLALLGGVASIGIWMLFFNGLASVLATKGVVSEVVNATEDPVPTSVEFSDYFHRITEAALADDERRRLIIVLDNLDRLNDEERHAVWGFLKSFIENKQVVRSDWYERMWVFVPWADAPIEESANPAASAGTASANTPEVEKTVVSGGVSMDVGLAEKLFQLRIDIPPPILIAWQTSLSRRLRKAFDRLLEIEVENCIVAFFGRRYRTDAEISIRRIVCFVNELVVLHYQHPSIPLDVLAAFVVSGGRDGVISVPEDSVEFSEHLSLINQLGSGSKKYGTGNTIDKPHLMTYFAQLRYGLSDPGLAMNHLLVPRWRQSLETGSLVDALKLLRSPSGISALKICAQEFMHWMGSAAVPHAAFRVLAILRAKSMKQKAPVWLQALSQSENWTVISVNVVNVMQASIPQSGKGGSLIKWFRAYFMITETRQAPNLDARRAAIDALGKYRPIEQADVEHLVELLLLPQCMEEMAAIRPPTLSLESSSYFLFWEKLGKVAIDDRRESVEMLHQKGLGLWHLKPDVMTKTLSSNYHWPDRQSFFDVFPIVARLADPVLISEAFDSLLQAMFEANELEEPRLPEPKDLERIMQIYLAELGSRQSFALLQKKGIRDRIFRNFTADKLRGGLRDVHLTCFLLLLVGTNDWESALQHTDNRALEQGHGGPRMGEYYFKRILTRSDVADPYVKALQQSTLQLAGIVEVSVYANEPGSGDKKMMLAYWRRIGEQLAAALLIKFGPSSALGEPLKVRNP